jgi:hypothetical protein
MCLPVILSLMEWRLESGVGGGEGGCGGGGGSIVLVGLGLLLCFSLRSFCVSVPFAFLMFRVTFNDQHLVWLWLMVMLALGWEFMFFLLLC